MEKQKESLDEVPDDCLKIVMLFSGPRSFLSGLLVCKHWSTLMMSQEFGEQMYRYWCRIEEQKRKRKLSFYERFKEYKLFINEIRNELTEFCTSCGGVNNIRTSIKWRGFSPEDKVVVCYEETEELVRQTWNLLRRKPDGLKDCIAQMAKYYRYHHNNRMDEIQVPLLGSIFDVICNWDADYLQEVQPSYYPELVFMCKKMGFVDLFNLLSANYIHEVELGKPKNRRDRNSKMDKKRKKMMGKVFGIKKSKNYGHFKDRYESFLGFENPFFFKRKL